jgi:aspartokinase/homoserine dehydrogenase 1
MKSAVVPARSARLSSRAPFARRDKELGLIVIGTGYVGSAFIDQVAAQKVRVCAIANTRQLISDSRGLDLTDWRAQLETATARPSVTHIMQVIGSLGWANVAVVDCTASREIVDAYGLFVEVGAHVITPNKIANVLPWQRYQDLLHLFERHEREFLYRTNVGAGLPILSTLADLVASGDTIHRIEGIFSGTLSYLFNQFDGTQSFSALLQDARRQGFTEPDPYTDLTGGDVATKLLVLARQLGWPLDFGDVKVHDLSGLSDADFAERYAEAAKEVKVLRYVARIENGEATAGLTTVRKDHPFANTRHTDNIVAFHTGHYNKTPLVIQGPGAGPEVTAAGVLADVHRLLRSLPVQK